MKTEDRRKINDLAQAAESILAQTEELADMLGHSHPVYAEQLHTARRLAKRISAELDVLGREPETDPVVFVVPFELLRIAQGHPMHFTDTDGCAVVLRLPTRQEYRESVEKARANLPGFIRDSAPPMPTDAEIDRLISPLPSAR